MGDENVWRVCRVIKGDCQRCPSSEVVGGDECVRSCYLHAVECINTVETGNPWRKTEGVKPPWTVKAEPPKVQGEVGAEKAAVKALGDDIGFGRIIQLAHECWDEMLEAKHGIKGHSESYQLAAAEVIRDRRQQIEPAADAQPQETDNA